MKYHQSDEQWFRERFNRIALPMDLWWKGQPVTLAIFRAKTEEHEMAHTKPSTPRVEKSKIEATLAERGKTHGDFRENGRIMQQLKAIARTGVNWPGDIDPELPLSMEQREAIDMILHKVGRILSGNPNEPDHWRDIAGYATLCQQIIEGTYHV